MAVLQLVEFDDGRLVLQGCDDASQNAEFSLFNLDGESGDPLAFEERTWENVDELPAMKYDENDPESFQVARQGILDAALTNGIELAEYID